VNCVRELYNVADAVGTLERIVEDTASEFGRLVYSEAHGIKLVRTLNSGGWVVTRQDRAVLAVGGGPKRFSTWQSAADEARLLAESIEAAAAEETKA